MICHLLIKNLTFAKFCSLAGYRIGGRGRKCYAAILPLDAGVDIRKVQDLLGHQHMTITRIYDKRRHSTAEIASHDVPI